MLNEAGVQGEKAGKIICDLPQSFSASPIEQGDLGTKSPIHTLSNALFVCSSDVAYYAVGKDHNALKYP